MGVFCITVPGTAVSRLIADARSVWPLVWISGDYTWHHSGGLGGFQSSYERWVWLLASDCFVIYPVCDTVAWITLLSQNALLVAGASTLCLMFYFEWNVCLNLALFVGLSAVTIVMGSLARLATVANTISIEKDWVVVIAGKDENTLAGE